MDYNIPVWTKEALGRSLTVEEFLADAEAQDLTVRYRLMNLLKKYSMEDVASIWFSGGTLAENKHKTDVNGMKVSNYSKIVIALYNDIKYNNI